MFSMMRRHCSFAGLVATLALVFAMSGGAWAAKKYLITSTSQISPSVLKKLKGKTGATGPAGAVGLAGAAGANGKAGANGTNGASGKSVLANEYPTGEPECEGLGGSEFEVEGSGAQTFACNGAEGPPGPITGELPSGVTLRGVWATPGTSSGATIPSISFGLALPTVPELNYIKQGEAAPAACGGTAEEPKATSGNLCFYVTEETKVEGVSKAILANGRAFKYGGWLLLVLLENGANAYGTWAVTR